jgi:hypothetical protein
MAEHINPFVPLGVDAGTWMGFEQRIRNRRFTALIEQFTQAVADGDRDAARAALDEARELRPDSPEVIAAAERLEALESEPVPAATGYIWSRIFGAVALLLIGVSMMIGLDWMRMPQPVPVAPPVAAASELGPLNLPLTDVVAAQSAPAQTASPASARTVPAIDRPAVDAPPSQTRWGKVLRVLGVEVRRTI